MSSRGRFYHDACAFGETLDEARDKAERFRRGIDSVRESTPNHSAATWRWVIRDPIRVPFERGGVRSLGWYIQQYLEPSP